MKAKQVCVYRPALNRHRVGELEFTDAFWPYVKEESTFRKSDLQSFFFEIKEFLRMRLCVICRFSSADLSFAEKLYIRGVRTEHFKRAVILGCCRKYISLINRSDGELIAHLSYFSDAVDEASDPALLSTQWEIKEQLELYKYEILWGVVQVASIAEHLRIFPEQLQCLLSIPEFEDTRAILNAPRLTHLTSEQGQRLSCLVRIHNAVLFSRGKFKVEWFENPNGSQLFAGVSPMKFMLDGGLKNMEAVRLYLYTRAGF